MLTDWRRYGNAETTKGNEENWKRRSGETGKKKIKNLTVGLHDTNEISGT